MVPYGRIKRGECSYHIRSGRKLWEKEAQKQVPPLGEGEGLFGNIPGPAAGPALAKRSFPPVLESDRNARLWLMHGALTRRPPRTF